MTNKTNQTTTKNVVLALNQQSSNIIKQHKTLLIFPLMNNLFSFCLFAIALVPLVEFEKTLWETQHISAKTALILFVCLSLFFSILHLFNTFSSMALSVCALNLLQNHTFHISEGFQFTCRHFWRLLKWKSTMTTIGPCYRFCESWIDDWESMRITQYLLHGIPWMTGTFFVIPVLIREKLGTFASMRRSAELVIETYGHNAAFRYQTSRVLLLIRLLAFIPMIIVFVIGNKTLIIIGVMISVLIFLSSSIVFGCTQGVLICALYLNAIGADVSRYFDVDLLKKAFQSVKVRSNRS